jgi:hypothetical protein
MVLRSQDRGQVPSGTGPIGDILGRSPPARGTGQVGDRHSRFHHQHSRRGGDGVTARDRPKLQRTDQSLTRDKRTRRDRSNSNSPPSRFPTSCERRRGTPGTGQILIHLLLDSQSPGTSRSPSDAMRPPDNFKPNPSATAVSITPAHASRACRSISSEQAASPNASCRRVKAGFRERHSEACSARAESIRSHARKNVLGVKQVSPWSRCRTDRDS